MDQGRIRPPYPVFRMMAGMVLPLVMFGVAKLGLWSELNQDQSALLVRYLKLSYGGEVSTHGFRAWHKSPDVANNLERVKRFYNGRTGWEILELPLCLGLVSSMSIFSWAYFADQRRLRMFRDKGRYIRGTIFSTAEEFQKTVKDPGMPIWYEEPGPWWTARPRFKRRVQV